MAQALDGLWARAPYLHNGSVPTLADLLRAPAIAKTFTVGYDVYDQQRVGFVSDGPDSKAAGRPSTPGCPATGIRATSTGPRCRKRTSACCLEF